MLDGVLSLAPGALAEQVLDALRARFTSDPGFGKTQILLKQGEVKKRHANGRVERRHLFLFNDTLAYAKIINVDTELGSDKKIVVFSLRDIKAGEEITYDYKFPVEDGSLKCSCGAPNCIGRMN